MMKKIFNHWPRLFLLGIVAIFFALFILHGKIPLPADTIVGLYHPFRDITWDNLISGVPFKNFLITDPVRQQYPWRLLSIGLLKNWQLPLWNSFNFSGTPLLANLQSAAFYPLNILFWLFNFNLAWGMQIVLQLLLAGFFFYLWLRVYHISKTACLFGGLSFIFSGFFVAWLEWNTILQVALWLPLILLAKEKIISQITEKVKNLEKLFTKKIFFWSLVLIFAESSSFLAGHLQTLFYVALVATLYLIVRLYQTYMGHPDTKKDIKYQLILFSATAVIVFLLISPQLLPTLEFILNSARSFDQPLGFRTDWYLPWKHLVQFLAPDFFGNPATLNYWGNWNYGEFVGYIGIIPLLLSAVAILGRRDKKTLFFAALGLVALVFALPNFISFIPYQLKLPFISTTAPSRLIFVTDFSLAVLTALGLDFILKEKKTKYVVKAGLTFFVLFGFVWVSIVTNFWKTDIVNLLVAKKNLYLPTGLFIVGWFILLLLSCHSRVGGNLYNVFYRIDPRVKPEDDKVCKFYSVLTILLLLLTSFDLLRFSQKFNPFVKSEWVFPQTKTIAFLQKQPKPFRIESLDDRILPPNFSSVYGLETIEGYDPLIDKRYAQFVAAVERNKPDISSFNFNRIITPKLYNNPFINILNVKYFLTLTDLNIPSLRKVFQEGQTKIYQNRQVLPRVFFVNSLVTVSSEQEAIKALFSHKNDLDKTAVVESDVSLPIVSTKNFLSKANIKTENGNGQSIAVDTETNNPSFLVLSQTLLSGWKAKIDGVKTTLYRADFILSGVVLPAGKHQVIFYYQPLSFLIGLANLGLGMVILLILGIKIWLKKASA